MSDATYSELPVPEGAERVPVYLRGANLAIMTDRRREILLAGPAGTGKSFAILQKLNAVALKYPGARIAMARQTHTSLMQSGIITLREKVEPEKYHGVRFYDRREFHYPNGSLIYTAGLDDPQKLLSSEWDIIYVQEATETLLDAWEILLGRLRNNKLPYQQIIGDCNPGPPSHWIKQREKTGALNLIETRHEDNPLLFDLDTKDWTPFGRQYIETLDQLTGVRKLRLRYGIWAAAEGMVYDNYDATAHLVTRSDLVEWGLLTQQGTPNRLMGARRCIAGVDWGFTNPGVLQVWIIDPDLRMYMVHETYMTGQIIGWWTDRAREIRETFNPEAFICDPSEPAYIAQFRSVGLNALPGFNSVAPGIRAVYARLQPARDGWPRMFFMREALAETDPVLVEKKLPIGATQEIEGYVWNDFGGARRKEEALKENDHSMDCDRYVTAYLDRIDQEGKAGSPVAGGSMPAIANLDATGSVRVEFSGRYPVYSDRTDARRYQR